MNASTLKWHVEDTCTDSFFFTRSSMKFFGDRMANYGVRTATIQTWTDQEPVEVWELYRKRPVKCGLTRSAYFRKDNFHQTFKKT